MNPPTKPVSKIPLIITLIVIALIVGAVGECSKQERYERARLLRKEGIIEWNR